MIYAIGDVHGRYDLLIDLHAQIMEDSKQYHEINTIVMLGDYVDRGPDSKKVIDFLMSEPFTGFYHVYLRGNHEDMMIKSLYGSEDDVQLEDHYMPIIRARGIFLNNGGDETLKSFGIDNYEDLLYNKHTMVDVFEPYKTFLNDLEYYKLLNGYLFVHAGIVPGVPIEEQSDAAMLWIRGKFLSSDHDHGYIVVHGHTPTTAMGMGTMPEKLSNRINIDTGAVRSGVLTAVRLDESHEIPSKFFCT